MKLPSPHSNQILGDVGELLCPQDNGWCVDEHGKDQNEGQYNLKYTKTKQECLKQCLAYPGATGCETSSELGDNLVCSVHTKEVARGSGIENDPYMCWAFIKCKSKILLINPIL